MSKRVTQEEFDVIKEHLEKGFSTRSVGRTVGRGKETIAKIARGEHPIQLYGLNGTAKSRKAAEIRGFNSGEKEWCEECEVWVLMTAHGCVACGARIALRGKLSANRSSMYGPSEKNREEVLEILKPELERADQLRVLQVHKVRRQTLKKEAEKEERKRQKQD